MRLVLTTLLLVGAGISFSRAQETGDNASVRWQLCCLDFRILMKQYARNRTHC